MSDATDKPAAVPRHQKMGLSSAELGQPRRRVYSTNAVAERLGVSGWQVRRPLQRGLVVNGRTINGQAYWWTEEDLPVLSAAPVRAGYLAPVNGNGKAHAGSGGGGRP
jgi:hypothetical protein